MTQTGPGGFTPTPIPTDVPGNNGIIGGYDPSKDPAAGWAPGGGGVTLEGQSKQLPWTVINSIPRTDKTGATLLYRDGDEWSPAHWGPDKVIKLQAELVQAGILSKTNVRPGRWDSASASAYRQVLSYANAMHADAKDALNDLLNHPEIGAAGGSAPGPYATTNPTDVKAAFRKTALEILGRELPQSEADKFAAQFKATEEAANQRTADAALAGTLNVEAAPSAGNAAEEYLRKTDPAGVHGFGMLSRMNEFEQMLSSAVG